MDDAAAADVVVDGDAARCNNCPAASLVAVDVGRDDDADDDVDDDVNGAVDAGADGVVVAGGSDVVASEEAVVAVRVPASVAEAAVDVGGSNGGVTLVVRGA